MKTFREWLADEEETDLAWADQFITGLAKQDIHQGDCTNESQPCCLCSLERILSEYADYCLAQRLKTINTK
jgi:hypothetical protein